MDAALDEARMLALRGELTASLRALEAILERQPDRLEALLLKAGVLLQQRDEAAALAQFARAAELAPQSSEALNGLARCLHAMGKDDEALAAAQAARERLGHGENFKHAAPVYLTLVWVYREKRCFREALAMAEEGLERCADAVLAQWASVVEEELADSQQERC